MTDRVAPPIHLTLVEPPLPGDARWEALATIAERLCGADAAGVAARSQSLRPALAALAHRLSRGGGSATVEAGGDAQIACAALAGLDGAMLWVERRAAPFDARALAQLDWLAAGGGDLLHALDAARGEADLLLREVRHRCANDLHLIGSLLSHQARFADEPGVAAALEVVASRVMMLSRARQQVSGDLVSGLRACIEALAAQVGNRGVAITLRVEGRCPPIDERRAAMLLLAANELAVNALKHGFGDGRDGRIEVTLAANTAMVVLAVEDDGAPMPGGRPAMREGSGLDLVGRLVAGIRAALIPPPPGTKRFTIEMQVARAAAHGRNR